MLQTDPSSIVPSSQEIQHVTREVLSRPEFQTSSGWETWINTAADWLDDALQVLALWSQTHPIWRWVLFALLSVLLVLVLVHLVRLLRADLAPERQRERRRFAALGGGENTMEEPSPPWQQTLLEVRQALHQDDGYRAIWLLHRYFLAVLDDREVLTFSSWKTNADYLQECPRTSPSYRLLSEMTAAYEHIVYAHRSVPLHAIAALLARVEDEQNSHRS
jgi:hypothetical protein